MDIRNTLRDSSFVKFLVGGVILLTLTGTGIYFAKKNTSLSTDNVDETQVVQTETGGAEGEGPLVTSEDSSDQLGYTEAQPQPIETESGESSSQQLAQSDLLPRTGPASTVIYAMITGALTYGLAYLLRNKLLNS